MLVEFNEIPSCNPSGVVPEVNSKAVVDVTVEVLTEVTVSVALMVVPDK
jgi:hypothetical protein